VGAGIREVAEKEARKLKKKLVVEISNDEDDDDDDIPMYETQHPELVEWAGGTADAAAGLRDPFSMQQDEIRFN
jgi:hypothetical protein